MQPVQIDNVQQQPLTERQQMVAQKMFQIRFKVSQSALTIIRNSSQMSKEEFTLTHIDPNQEAIQKLDERAKVFFNKMMEGVNEQIKPFYSALEQVLLKLTVAEGGKVILLPENNIPMIQRFIEAAAYPEIEALRNEFDTIATSIVDDITGIK